MGTRRFVYGASGSASGPLQSLLPNADDGRGQPEAKDAEVPYPSHGKPPFSLNRRFLCNETVANERSVKQFAHSTTCAWKSALIYHPNPTDFIKNSGEYGALGKTSVALSNLEFAHDEFIFKTHETHPDLSIRLSKNFPRHFKEKTDFLVHAVSNISKLRQIPIFQTGELNLVWLQYQLDELYETRSIIAHGSLYFSESTPGRIAWTFERYVTKQKGAWTREAVKISNGYLASVHYSASILKNFFASLTKCLEDSSCWEDYYKEDKEIRRNRKALAELADTGLFVDHNGWIGAFPPLGPVE